MLHLLLQACSWETGTRNFMTDFRSPSLEGTNFASFNRIFPSSMATEDAASFDHETACDNLPCNPNPEPSVRKMSINIPVNDDGDFAVKKDVPLSVKNVRVLHSQVMRIREEDERLGEDLNQKIAFLPIASQVQDVLFSFSRRTFPSRLGMKAGFR